MRILAAAGRREIMWRNGGGTTADIAAFPPGADLHSFGWRVSVARIDGAGPFSRFPEIDRTLVLAAGGPLRLASPTLDKFLKTGSAPLSFAGEAALMAQVHRPATAINVMTRRGRFCHRVERLSPDGAPAGPSTGSRILVMLGGGRLADGTWLDRLDAIQLEEGEAATDIAAGGEKLLISIAAA